MEGKIEIVIITGYLGAGKTTLLNKLVASYGDRKIGLLVNDFGKVPVDGSLIQGRSADLENNKIYEIGNGSIFCSCLTSSFVFGLKYFMRQKPEILFIETSGMSDPGSMARLLNEYELRDAFTIRHVLAVVDSTNVLKMRAHLTFVDRQVIASNTVLLNKADLVDHMQKSEVYETIRQINEHAHVKWTSFCDFDYASLAASDFLPDSDAQSCNTSDNAPGTMFLGQYNFPRDKFEDFLKSLVDKTLRLKGYYELDGSILYYSNNNGQIETVENDSAYTGETGITLIYEKKQEGRIKEGWRNFREGFEL